MSNKICSCDAVVGNLALPKCSPIFGKPSRIIFAPVFKSDGTKFGIDSASALDTTYFNGLQFAVDPNARIYPVPADLKNVKFERTDPDYQEFEDKSKYKLNEGSKSFEAILPEVSNLYLQELEKAECSSIGFYFVDVNGTIVGIDSQDGTGLLYSMPIAKGTMDYKFIHATDTTIQQIMVRFEVASSVCDSEMGAILASEMPYDLRNLVGIMGGTLAEVSNTLTGIVLTAKMIYGSVGVKVPITLLLSGDMVLYNTTTSAAIVITSVTEAPNGTYTLVFAAQTASDAYTLTATKEAFSFNVLAGTLTA